ncbi:putative pumilio-family RNA binding repeat [Lyophyllum shimeji]|uniref:Pumilio-family RNA binding repeat n=1 Tax=Lyophyllum shimeji TaxID=47721 RepID=A0A9P3UV32_LYOSH|nr:putative pumilio-family RNA binding repeat [Lyophyllum shimeji]
MTGSTTTATATNGNGQFLPLYDPSPPPAPPASAQRRQQPATLAASIWAPQPQPSEATWPKTLDSFSRVAEQQREFDSFDTFEGTPRQQQDREAVVRREDVFGPVPTQVQQQHHQKVRDVGAIGDGRRKGSPGFDDTHVEQLLRTLNLNSPAPTAKKPALSLNLDASPSSPDFSPASATSSLLTPTDLSPSTRSFGGNAKLQHSPYELAQPLPTGYLQQHPSLFEHSSPVRTVSHENFTEQGPIHAHHYLAHSGVTSPLYRSSAPPTSYPPPPLSAANGNAPAFTFFEPFAEPPAPGYPTHAHAHGQISPTGAGAAVANQNQNSNSTLSLPRSLYNPNTSPASAPASVPPSARSRLPPVAGVSMDWRLQPQAPLQSNTNNSNGNGGFGGDWLLPGPGLPADKFEYSSGAVGHVHGGEEGMGGMGLRTSFAYQQQGQGQGLPPHLQQHTSLGQYMHGQGQGLGLGLGLGLGSSMHANEPINFLSLLHPSSSPPYAAFVERIIRSSDQQASIFLQQKLKVADVEERAKIVDAICARGFEMMAHRFGNWAVQRCLEAASNPEERRKLVGCMRGRVVELATNCYGCHVLQKALDCEEDIRLLIVSELLLGDPAQTLVNKHASHVWSKIMELSWTPPAPPIFAYVNKSLKGKWASLACHETGSLVVQHAFENLEAEAKDGIVDELINHGHAVFAEVAKNQWGSYCIQHILEHGSDAHRAQTLQHLLDGLLDFATSEQGAKSVTKALKEGGKATLDRIVERMCEPAKGSRRAMIVDLALSVTGSQLIASVLPTADKDQRALLYDCIRGHIVTLRGCKTGSKVIWLFDRMRAYYGY